MEFEKKYVHFMWDDELEGKLVFLGDTIDDLIDNIKHYNVRVRVCKNDSEDCNIYPFKDTLYRNNYTFCYYDPNYDCKLAYAQGKKIEYRLIDDDIDAWYFTEYPSWQDGCEYRIFNENNRLLTNRELTKWLRQGNGELLIDNRVYMSYSYDNGKDDEEIKPCDSNMKIKVRKWEDKKWHEPTTDYCHL